MDTVVNWACKWIQIGYLVGGGGTSVTAIWVMEWVSGAVDQIM